MAFGESERKEHERLLSNLKTGESFFVPHRPEELMYIRKMGYRLKIKLSIRFVVQDEIYGQMGSRVIRTG